MHDAPKPLPNHSTVIGEIPPNLLLTGAQRYKKTARSDTYSSGDYSLEANHGKGESATSGEGSQSKT
jgi:hypothetical protein